MLSALKLSAFGAILALVGTAAVAGDAPVAYYPSLGYGSGVYEAAPGGYVDDPVYANDYGPPPQRGPARPCHCAVPPPPPPIADCHCNHGQPLPPPGPPIVYGGQERSSHAERSFQGEHVYGEVRRDEYDYDSGWRFRRIEPPPGDCRCAGMQRERFEGVDHISDSFFADAGGVGPDEFEGGGGGGGGVIVGGGASAGAFAFASASAHASASIGIHIGRHGGGHHGGGHMPHGCGCKR